VCRTAKSSAKSPELIARYCDQLLRKSPANADRNTRSCRPKIIVLFTKYVCLVARVEDALTAIVQIFVYVDDQDVFQVSTQELIFITTLSVLSFLF
jgi:hypothetical protein